MKSLVDAFRYLLLDCSKRCNVPFQRDWETISRRTKNEGDSFLTITLPAFCKDFERSLDEGRISPSSFPNFRKVGCKPAFLQDYMSNVFGSDSFLLDSPSTDCIFAIRQICLFAKKILRPCTPARLQSAEDGFIQVESEVTNDQSGSLFDAFSAVSGIVMSSIADWNMYSELKPMHGPGAAIERTTSNGKWSIRKWTERLEKVLPYSEFAIASLRNVSVQSLLSVDFRAPEQEQPVKVVFVPKTLKTPRVIAVEPVHMQYMQQAILRWIVPRIESGRYTSGHVNFTDQSINQSLACSNSRSGRLATLDMSEASDRVSLQMVTTLLKCDPFLKDCILACRSQMARLPSGKEIPLNKHASMGSALCFPMEAMVFYCLIIASRIHRAKERVTARSVFSQSRDVYVYGDDLIVPADEAFAISSDLESLRLKVNKRKSFWTGKFRESCGSDYYDGVKVTPCYLRHDYPANRSDASGVLSVTACANQAFELGLYRLSTFLKERVEEVVGLLPTVPADSPAIGWHFYSEYVPPRRWNKDLQRNEYLCLVPVPRRVRDPLDGDPALAKCFRVIGSRAKTLRHLLESVGAYSLALKRKGTVLNF